MNKNNKGFALIELIIVIAILGIMVVVTIPKFHEMNNRNKGIVPMYKLSNGDVVKCYKRYTISCGVNLAECGDGKEYACQQNVVILKQDIPNNLSIPK